MSPSDAAQPGSDSGTDESTGDVPPASSETDVETVPAHVQGAEGEPPPTEFEKELSAGIDEALGRGSGTVWGGVEDILASGLGMPRDDVGAIGVTRDNVIYNRPLTSGLIREPRKFVVIPVVEDVGIEKELEVVKGLVPQTRHLTTVGIADKSTGTWRVRKIVDVEDLGVGEQIIEHFPVAQRIPMPFVPITRPLPSSQSTPVDELDLETLVGDFHDFLEKRQLIFTELEQLDLLAAALGSQFILFAGPSGTGKSTAADALATYLSPRSEKLEVPRGLQRQAELLGYYSTYGGRFVETPHTAKLLNLGDDGSGTTPFAIIEEANLSPFEGYFSAALHGLSRVVTPTVDVPLHGETKRVETMDGRTIPSTLRIGPYPRFLGTINVDHTAPAPARKVAGRACVVLLEPPTLSLAMRALTAPAAPVGSLHGAGAHAVGEPSAALAYLEARSELQSVAEPFSALAGLLAGDDALGSNRVTPRDSRRAGMYMAWFRLLARAGGHSDSRACQLAAENAVLHFVLPGLSGTDFAASMRVLRDSEMLDAHGLLIGRLERLSTSGGDQTFGPPADFWSALS